MTDRESVILDGYAGAGGWDEGARILGLPTVGLEIWHDACVTATRAGHPRIRCDIATYPTAPFRGKVKGKIDSPPCQPWSAAGNQLGKLDQPRVHTLVDRMAAGDDRWQDMTWEDHRSHHAAQPVRWMRDLRPEWVCLEQVPQVLPLWEHIGRILRGWGYAVTVGVLNSANYGVPQTRERAILIASRVRPVAMPEATHERDPKPTLFGQRLPWRSMADALGWGMTARPSMTVTGGGAATGGAEPFGNAARQGMQREREAGRWTLVNRRDSPKWVAEHGERRNRDDNEPAPTITGEAHRWTFSRPATTVQGDPRIGRPGHKDRAGGESQFGQDSVRITVAEAAILQTFPADYPWHGSKGSQHLQVGNAVPPRLAAAMIGAATGIDWQSAVARHYAEGAVPAGLGVAA